jgi:hypothetical protein
MYILKPMVSTTTQCRKPLHGLLNLRLLEVTSWNRSARLLSILTMQFQQLLKIKFGRLEDLDLAYVDLQLTTRR